MVERPVMLLPVCGQTRGIGYKRLQMVHEQLGHHVRFSYRYPKDLKYETPTPVGSVYLEQVRKIEQVEEALAEVGPEWTTVGFLWYNTWSDARLYARAASRHVGRVAIPCTGTDIVPHVPDEYVIGYDNNHQRKSSDPQIPVEQLVGRDVMIVGGIPRRQFTTFCELTFQGVNVVAVEWPSCWIYNSLTGKWYWDMYMQRVSAPHLSTETLLLEGTKHALAWWDMGLRRINQYLSRMGRQSTAG